VTVDVFSLFSRTGYPAVMSDDLHPASLEDLADALKRGT
jgi:hypothetical protein